MLWFSGPRRVQVLVRIISFNFVLATLLDATFFRRLRCSPLDSTHVKTPQKLNKEYYNIMTLVAGKESHVRVIIDLSSPFIGSQI